MREEALLEEIKSDVSSEVGAAKDKENPLNSTKVKLKGYLLKKVKQEE